MISGEKYELSKGKRESYYYFRTVRVGKGTVCRALLEKYPDVSLSISATTRKPRVGEQNGREYFSILAKNF